MPSESKTTEQEQQSPDKRRVDVVLRALAELAIEEWLKTKGSKNPTRVIPSSGNSGIMNVWQTENKKQA